MLTDVSDPPAFVHLKVGPNGGLAVPTPALMLAFDLENRGFTLRQDGDALVVQPHQQLTSDDCQQIRRWKRHLMALINYEAPEVG